MGHVLDDDSDDVAPEDVRGSSHESLSNISLAKWRGAVGARIKSIEEKLDDHTEADEKRFDCIDEQLEAGQVRFNDIEKTLSRYGGVAVALLLVIELTLAAMGIAASAGWFSKPAAAAPPAAAGSP